MNGDITSEAIRQCQRASKVVCTQWLRYVSDAQPADYVVLTPED